MRLKLRLLLVLLLAPIASSAQEVPRNCDLEFPNRPQTRLTIVTAPDGNQNAFSGGGVVARCIGQDNLLTADSAEYYESQGLLLLIGNVHYTEARVKVDARTMTYYQADDHLHAEGNVVAVLDNGTTMRGPNADYYRSVPGRPVSRLFASGRPQLDLVQRDTSGRNRPPQTARLLANQITMQGDSIVYAGGQVVLTRPDLVAKGDSAFLDGENDFARLMKSPQIQGKGARAFTLDGGIIDLYSRDRQLERVVATPNGHILSQDIELVADSIDLRLKTNQLERAMAWGAKRARALSPEREILADSIDVIMPGQKVREVRALRGAYATSQPDSGILTEERDWIRGDTIVARFDTVATGDSTSRPRVREIVAEGKAQSYYQLKNSRGPSALPTVNYVRGRIITIDFAGRRVTTVTVVDQAVGMFVEPGPARAPAAPGPAPVRRPPAND
ncbi:MAG TPA: hypothetical protein VNJ04_01190 [Gemmatimonadaceae bacterium]|nr:hypothetical protein [Gemmatimonadaceae bacterium]